MRTEVSGSTSHRVEMVLPSLDIGGMEHMVATLSINLLQRGLDVGITCIDQRGHLADKLQERGLRISYIPAPGALSNLYAPALTAHFRRLRPSIVHSHTGVWGRACRAARLAGVSRTIHTVHGKPDTDPWFDIPLKRWEARHSDAIVAVSNPLADDLVNRVGLQPSCLHIIENGIDIDRFHPDEHDRQVIRHELGVQNDLVFGTIARLASVKNIRALLEAFAFISPQLSPHFSTSLLIVGSGPLERDLRAYSAELGLQDKCHFLGARDDTNRLHRALDFFVLPSFAEGTSISLLEAMATGTFAVTTPVGGNSRLLGDGDRGVLARGTGSDSLAEALLQAVRLPTRREISVKAMEHVRAEYSIDRMLRDYLDLYF